MIGLPQQFRGGRGRAPMPQAPAPVRRAPAIQEPKFIAPPEPVVRPPRQSDASGGRGVKKTGNPYPKGSHNYEVYEGRGGRPRNPVRELPNKGRAAATTSLAPPPRTPMVQPRILNQGGYMSRASYGIVDNLKGK